MKDQNAKFLVMRTGSKLDISCEQSLLLFRKVDPAEDFQVVLQRRELNHLFVKSKTFLQNTFNSSTLIFLEIPAKIVK